MTTSGEAAGVNRSSVLKRQGVIKIDVLSSNIDVIQFRGMKTQRHKGTEAQRNTGNFICRISLCLCAFVSLCVFSERASAQVNLSGVWDNLGILHEDWPDRLFGPELGDYTGVPLNNEARLRAKA